MYASLSWTGRKRKAGFERLDHGCSPVTSLLPPVRESPPTGCRKTRLSVKTPPTIKETLLSRFWDHFGHFIVRSLAQIFHILRMNSSTGKQKASYELYCMKTATWRAPRSRNRWRSRTLEKRAPNRKDGKCVSRVLVLPLITSNRINRMILTHTLHLWATGPIETEPLLFWTKNKVESKAHISSPLLSLC